LEQYLQLDWKPRRSKLSDEQQAQLLERAATENGFGSQAAALAYLQNEFAVSYTQGGLCLLFQRLKIKAKEPRPRNTKASAEDQAGYKKTSLRE
jgi:transposase